MATSLILHVMTEKLILSGLLINLHVIIRRSIVCPRFFKPLLLLLQHVPKTNGEIPSVDEAFSDHQRLLDR